MTSALLSTASLSLPNELALIVVDYLEDDNKTLCNLARTSRGLQHLAEEKLYKTISLLSVKHLQAIIEAFTYRHDRVRAVQTLKILYQYKPQDLDAADDTRATFNECVAHMVNLREWHIESPYDNSSHWEVAGGKRWVEHDMQRFRQALENACVEGPKEADLIAAERRLGKDIERTVGLALLEKLTIHSHGVAVDFWELGGFHCLFRHPALRYLHVSCVVFPDQEIPELASHIKKTPLTTLIFDECELEPKSLLSILRTPAKLKSLTLGENCFNLNQSRRLKPTLTKNPSASLEALSNVAHSLESLTHLDPNWRADHGPYSRSIRPPGEGMRNFHSLKYMECDPSSFLHKAAILNRDLAPPSLETLRLRRNWQDDNDFWDQPPELDHYAALPSLNTLELLQTSPVWDEFSEDRYICEEERLRNRHAKAYKLHKAGVNLKMLIEMHKSANLIPPYLHGELLPITHCLYDASEVGFHRHIRHGAEETDTENANLEAVAISTVDSSHTPDATHGVDVNRTATPPPETDQLGNSDIRRIRLETRSALRSLMHRFIRPARQALGLDDSDDDFDVTLDDEDDFEVDDLDEDEDMELDLELDEDDDEFEDGDGPIFFEHNGEYYVQMYESETDEEDGDDDDEMHDAVETQQPVIDELD